MTVTPTMPGSALARAVRPIIWIVMPLLGLVNQYLAVRTAQALEAPFGLRWLGAVARIPWTQAWVACEIVTFAAWMVVLSQVKLSAAFPMTAVGYALVVGLGWTVFAEPVSLLQLVGGAAILGGVWLLGEGEAPP